MNKGGPKLVNADQCVSMEKRSSLGLFLANKPACLGAITLAILIGIVITWPIALKIAPLFGQEGQAFAITYHPLALSDDQFQAPSVKHWFGTDVHGRDLFSRVVYGTGISILVGITGALISFIIGVAWGTVAGYAGGRIDAIMMRIVDVLYSMPGIIVVIVLVTTSERFVGDKLTAIIPAAKGMTRFFMLIIGLGAFSWLTMARIIRAQVLSLKNLPFIDAAKVLGASHSRIIFRHIIPNVLGVAIVYWTLAVPSIVLYESFLSYLGLGIQPPMASLGSLIAEGVEQINPVKVYWWLIVCPGAVLLALLVSLNLVGDASRDALETKRLT
jgi:ABC-type dipeptide/oligopeptide/nickel transport system permease subunit